MNLDKDYEILNHTADIGIKITANTLPAIFNKAILATADLLSGGVSTDSVIERRFSVQEENVETAMVSVLEEIVFLFENELFLPSFCSVVIHGDLYEISLKGNVFSAEEIKNGTEIKAVTYHQLKIEEVEDRYNAKIIFDV